MLLEIQLAQNLNSLWQNNNVTPEKKNKMFHQTQLAHTAQHPAQMTERSHLQGFDAKHEKQESDSDFKVKSSDTIHRRVKLAKNNDLKTTDQVVHERMSERPFVKYEDFDVAEFTDYGKIRYDKKEETRVADASGGKGQMKGKKKK